MSAVQEAIGQRERALQRLFRWPSGWPLLAMPTSLIVYVLVVLACDLALIGCDVCGTIEAWRSGHRLNAELVRRLKMAHADDLLPPMVQNAA